MGSFPEMYNDPQKLYYFHFILSPVVQKVESTIHWINNNNNNNNYYYPGGKHNTLD